MLSFPRSLFLSLLMLPGIAAWGQTVPEREPNDVKEQAMLIQPGMTVAASFSRPHATALRRGEDVDHYRIAGLVSPGIYTVTITPGHPECKYVADVAHTPLVIRGVTSVVFELTGQGTTRVTRHYGSQPEDRATLPNEPRELDVLVFYPSFQCVEGGPWYDEIPYRISVSSGGPATPYVLPPPAASGGGQVVRELEPNDTREQAMTLQPDVIVESSFSRAHATSLRRGEDVDNYHVVGLKVPGIYTVTITPANPACRYVADVAHTPLVIQGVTTVVFEFTGQGRTLVTRHYGSQPEDRATIFADLHDFYIMLYNPSFQCVSGGPFYDELAYRLSIQGGGPSAGGAGIAPSGVPGSAGNTAQTGGTAALAQEFSIAPGSALELQLPRSATLDLLARLAWDKQAGANYALDVLVNGQRVAGPLRNKAASMRYADGRSYAYLDAAVPGWLVFYSPDFRGNDTPGSGGYQVMTDAGQAYHYQWDIAALAGSGPTMRLRLVNNGRGANAAIVVRLPAAAVVVSTVPTPAPPAVAGGAARIFDITMAREVAWGQPVGASDSFAPTVNPIYVWFHHQGITPGTAITAVWFYTSSANPIRIGDGSVTVTPPSDWGQFNFELGPGKLWPVGDYRVELTVAGRVLGEARFHVVKPAP